MTLKDSLDRLYPDKRPNTCSVFLMLRSLGSEDSAALSEAIEIVRLNRETSGKGYTSSWIAEALKAEGHQLSASAIRRHVRRECRCPE